MSSGGSNEARRPNVVLIMTDDQGYSDLACTGNPWIRTPNLDEFFVEATRLPTFTSHLCAHPPAGR